MTGPVSVCHGKNLGEEQLLEETKGQKRGATTWPTDKAACWASPAQIGDSGLEHFSDPRATQGLKLVPKAPQNALEVCTTSSSGEGLYSSSGMVIMNNVLKI